MCHKTVLSFSVVSSQFRPRGDGRILPSRFLLLLRSRLLGGLLGSSLLLGRTLLRRRFLCRSFCLGRLHLLQLRFLLGQLGSLEALSAKSDLRDAHRRVRLPVTAKLLVLFLAFVMEH